MVDRSHHTKDLFEAFILAGGISSRMGRPKHLLDFNGESLIGRTIQLVKPLVKKVTVVGAMVDSLPPGIRSISDESFAVHTEAGRSKGPLTGMATALSHSQSPWNLILACDLPYLTADWLHWLLSRAEKSQSHGVVPKTIRGLEPLAAVYRTECAIPIRHAVLNGIRKVTDALSQFAIETVDEAEWSEIDPEGLVLRNMNTPADYDEARARFQKKNSHA